VGDQLDSNPTGGSVIRTASRWRGHCKVIFNYRKVNWKQTRTSTAAAHLFNDANSLPSTAFLEI